LAEDGNVVGGKDRAALRRRLGELEAEVARLRRELDASRWDASRCRAILESALDYAILTVDPAGRVTSWNAGAAHLLGWGEDEAQGMDSRLTFTPEDRASGAPEAEMAQAAAEGRAEDERWHLRKDGTRFWGSGLLVPLDGSAEPGFLKIMRDRTERREGDERQGVLLRELAHRVKNTLALILSMARQTGSRAADLVEFVGAFEGRLQALATAHDLLSASGWRSTSLAALVDAALAPHRGRGGGGGGEPIRAEVRDLPLRPAAAQNLVLALHELATNAARHGALSAPGGRVELEVGPGGDDLVLTWREVGGPAAAAPSEPGFGTLLLEQLVAYQHGGRIAFDWRPDGLVCTLRLPLLEVVDLAMARRGKSSSRRPPPPPPPSGA
jgi:PAS domain S-box-containing protein